MKHIPIIAFVFCFLLCFHLPLPAGEDDGGFAASFLDWGVDARAIALGRAYSAAASGSSALFWNPAAIAQSGLIDIQAMHSLLYLDRRLTFGAVAFPLSRVSIAAGWFNLNIGQIQQRGTGGELLGEFSDQENLIMAGGAIPAFSLPGAAVYLGAVARYYHHLLFDYRGSGLGSDGGILVRFKNPALKYFSVSVVAQNLGAKLKWNTSSNREETIPRSFRVGMALAPKLLPVHLMADLEKSEFRKARFHVGMEYWLSRLALRGGWDHDRLTGGIGLLLSAAGKGILLNYAVHDDHIANKLVHFFGLNLKL